MIKDITNQRMGLYVHIPFCKSRCSYCDFYSSVGKSDVAVQYVDELCKEIASCGEIFSDKIIDTLYIGGGTPSVIDATLIEKILHTVEQSFKCNFIEKSIEMNPNAYNKISTYASMGFDRISIGIQSTDDVILKKMKRSHTAEQGIRALETANKYFKNISCDLILGIDENQDIKKDLSLILPLVTHLSSYILIVEDGTLLKKQLIDKTIDIATEATTIEQYFTMYNIAKDKGFMPYEISNFALLGSESKHNQKYWNMSEYLGVGASAHSLVDGKRFYNVSDIKKYCEGEHRGNNMQLIERGVSIEDEKTETIMLALRTTNGLNIREFNKKFNCNFLKDYALKIKLIEGAVAIKKDRFFIKSEFLLVMNTIIAGLL